MLPISITPQPAPISARPVSSTGQLGASVNRAPPMAGEHQHADHGMARPETIEEEAAGDLHRGKAEEERAGQRAQRFRPDGEVAHQVEADGDVGGAEKMAGDIGGGHGRDDDQAPAVGQRPLGGLHRRKGRFRLFSCCCGEPMRAWERSSTSNPPPTLSAAPASRAERGTTPCAKTRARKKSGAQVARRISPTSFGGWWPEPGGGAWPRTRIPPAIAARDMKSAGAGDKSAEMMIPPAAPGEGELDHMACAQKNPARSGARRINSCSLDRAVSPQPPSARGCASCAGRTAPGWRPPRPSPAGTALRSGTPARGARRSGSARGKR